MNNGFALPIVKQIPLGQVLLSHAHQRTYAVDWIAQSFKFKRVHAVKARIAYNLHRRGEITFMESVVYGDSILGMADIRCIRCEHPWLLKCVGRGPGREVPEVRTRSGPIASQLLNDGGQRLRGFMLDIVVVKQRLYPAFVDRINGGRQVCRGSQCAHSSFAA